MGDSYTIIIFKVPSDWKNLVSVIILTKSTKKYSWNI